MKTPTTIKEYTDLNIQCSDYDGKPIKNKLPTEIEERFKTEKQWLYDEGKQVKENAKFVEMHPNATYPYNNKLCKYYFDTEVEDIPNWEYLDIFERYDSIN